MRLSPFLYWLGAEYMYSVLTALLPTARPTHFLAPSPDYPAAGPHRLYQGYKGQRRQQVDPYGRPRCHPFGCGAGLTMTAECTRFSPRDYRQDYAALPTTAGRTLLWSRSAEAGNNLASIVVVEAARSLAMAADCPITQFIQFRPCSLEAAGLEIKVECPRRNSYRRRSRCCRGFGVHHFVDSVVVGGAQEDRVAPLL